MGLWLNFTILSGIILIFFYLTYRLFLAGDNQPRFNRHILLFIYVLSTIIPLYMMRGETHTATASIEIVTPTVTIAGTDPQPASILPAVLEVVAYIYLAGALAVTIATAIACLRLKRTIAQCLQIKDGDNIICIVDNNRFAPFSWMHYIVMNACDYSENKDIILTHERAHIRYGHRWDLLLARVIEIILWYNPASWLMTRELRSIHEFQADRAVVDARFDRKQYQMLLIKKAVGLNFQVLANSLNHSNL